MIFKECPRGLEKHSGGHYSDVKGRLFVSYQSYLVLLKYMTG